MLKNNPFFDVLSIRNFQKIWGSQVLTQMTINLINFTIILRVYGETHSNVAVSLVWTFYAIPAILLGPFSGAVVDFVSRRKVLKYSTFIMGIIVLSYLLVKQKLWPIYSIIFFYSLVNQLYIPAEASTLPFVVPKNYLPVANTYFLFTIYGSFLLGFGLAGPLIRLVGKEGPFILGSAFLFIASFLVAKLPTEKKSNNSFSDLQIFLQQAKEGYLFIKDNPPVLFPLLLLVFAQVIVGVVAVLAPSLATELLAIDLLDAGPILVFPAGIGALLGSQIVIWALRRKTRKKNIASFGLFTASVAFLTLALILPSLGNLRVLVSVFMAALLGISFVFIILPAQTFIQEVTPTDFRARVFGMLGFGITVASVLPVLLTAAISDLLNVNTMLIAIGVFTFLIGLYLRRGQYAFYTNNRS